MNRMAKIAGLAALALAAAALTPSGASAQVPVAVAPIIVDTAAPIIISAVTPKPNNTGLGKLEGFVMNANIAQITVRAKANETSLQTFSLSAAASVKMQAIVDKGGYQYGDKVTVYYNPTTKQALKIKGKPSKPS